MVKGIGRLFKSTLSDPILILTIIILLIVIGFSIYRYFNAYKENFDATSIGINNSGSLADNKTNGTGPSASTLISGIGAYIAKASDPVTAQSPAVTTIIQKPIDFDELENLCAGVSEPLKLRRHKPKDISGCGWYYKDGSSEFSFPAYGTIRGPINPKLKEKANGGQWFFKDLSEAQKKEDIKRCKKITTCDIADLYPSVCGFCPSLGYGVPLDRHRLSKYPKIHNASCKGTIIHSITKCPKQERNEAATRDAKGKMHYPERLPPPVCQPTQGKIARKCLKFLAKSAGVEEEGNLIDMIEGDSKGHFREGTLENRTFKKMMGILKKYGRLPLDMDILGNGRCKRSAAIQYYVKLVELTGFGINEITRQAAGYLTRGQKFPMEKFMKENTGPFILADLTDAFKKAGGQPAGTAFPKESDVASFDGKKLSEIQKRFDKMCKKDIYSANTSLQKEAIKKCLGIELSVPVPGCDAKPVFVFNGAACQSGNSLIGDVTVQPTTGVEIFWYSWDSDLTFPERRNQVATFYGREIRTSLPSIAAGDPVSSPFSTTDPLAFMARSIITYKGPIHSSVYNFTATEGVAIKTNSTVLYRSWIQGTSGSGVSNNFKMSPLEKNYTELYWFSSKPNVSSLTVTYKDNSGRSIPVPPTMCGTRVPKGFPIARWDFFTGEAQEKNSILSSSTSSSGFSFEKISNNNCMKFTGPNTWVRTDNKIRGSAFRSFAAMIYYEPLSTSGQTSSYIFALRKNVGSAAAPNFLDGAAIEAGIGKSGFVFAVLKPGNSVARVAAPGTLAGSGDAATSVFASVGAGANASSAPLSQTNLLRVRTNDNSLQPNMWNHVAIVFSTDYTTITIYINGVSAAKESGTVDTKFYNTTIFDYGSMGLSYTPTTNTTAVNAFKGGMAWQHWFDYPMCIADVLKDYKSQFCDSVIYPVYNNSGWTMTCPLTIAPSPPISAVIAAPPPIPVAKVAVVLPPFSLLQIQQAFIMGGGTINGTGYPKTQIAADAINISPDVAKPGFTLTDLANLYKSKCGPTSSLSNKNSFCIVADTPAAPPPPTSDGLTLWLDASDSSSLVLSGTTVTTWKDKSGKGYDATGVNGPTLVSGKILLNGAKQHFTTKYPATAAEESTFIVFSSNNHSQSSLVESSAPGGRQFQNDGHQGIGRGPGLASMGVRWIGMGTIPTTVSAVSLGELLYNSAGVNIYLNGKLSKNSPGAPGFRAGLTVIGGSPGQNGYYLNGTICEVVIYSSLITKEQRQNVEGRLAWKWGFQKQLPSDHPFFTIAPSSTSVSYLSNSTSSTVAGGPAIVPKVSALAAPVAAPVIAAPAVTNRLSIVASDVTSLVVVSINLPSLQVWLDSSDTSSLVVSGSTVTLWKDKSGKGNNAIGVNGPVKSSSRGITFDSTKKQYFTTNYTAQAPEESTFIVFSSNNRLQSSLVESSAPGGRQFQNDGHQGIGRGPGLASMGVRWIGMGTIQTKISAVSMGELLYNSSGVNIYLNGNLSKNSPGAPGFRAGLTVIGGSPGQNGYYLNGTICEVIIYNSLLSTVQRQKIEGYLAWKWGFQTELPATHPYYKIKPEGNL